MRNRSVVTAVKTTRYYIYGRGYNSNLTAHMQIAKRWVLMHLEKDWQSARPGPGTNINTYIDTHRNFDALWWEARYPAREGCPCHFCSMRKYSGIPGGRGCWISKMADYRQIAREIIDGERNQDGSPKVLALTAGEGR